MKMNLLLQSYESRGWENEGKRRDKKGEMINIH
jgi:hypothetical protein